MYVSTTKNCGIPRISVGNSTIVLQEVRNGRPTRNRTQRAHVSESAIASTSQSTGSTASQTKTPTLGAIAQLGMPQFFGLIRVDGKIPWISDSRVQIT